MPKISELWTEVEKSLSERTSSGLKMAILEAHKVLYATLESKGYPGKKIEDKLYWAGYSLREKNGLAEALEKRDDILDKFEYRLSDLEAEELIKKYKHVIDEVVKAPKFSLKDRLKMITETQLSPKSVLLWRNLGIFIGFFVAIKLLDKTEVGMSISKWLSGVADFVISWQFLLLVMVIIGLIYALNVYLSNKSKVKIKEDE